MEADLLPLVNLHDARCAVFTDLSLEPLHPSELAGPMWLQLAEITEACYDAELDRRPSVVWDLMATHNEDAQQALRTLGPEKCQLVRAHAAHALHVRPHGCKPLGPRRSESTAFLKCIARPSPL